MTGDEDDRHIRPIDDALLDIGTVEVWKPHIKDQAARSNSAGALEEFLGRGECLRSPTIRAEQQLERFAHGYIIVDNEHDRRAVRLH